MAKVCLVAHFAYGAIAGGQQGHVGGVERQMSLMARWLAAKGHDVSLLTWQEGGKSQEFFDGVRVIKMCRQDAGVPGLRFFYPRWHSLEKALSDADADVYYQNCGEFVTGQVAFWCRRHNKKFVYSIASDADVDPELPEMKTLRERFLYRYGLAHADLVVSQTEVQRDKLIEGFSLDSIVMPMPCPGPDEDEYRRPEWPVECPSVLWAARISPLKRLELLLDIAQQLPNIQFVVAGALYHDNQYTRELMSRMGDLNNVNYLGRVERERMSQLYQNSHLFCCTSEYEGFPNTFLESWSHGVPIVSTFDPDSLIDKLRLGVYAQSANELAGGIEKLLDPLGPWLDMSDRCRDYYLCRHSVDHVMERFEEIFITLSRKNRG